MKVKTDHKWRNMLYGYELTEKEKGEFDYISPEDIDASSFFRYKGRVYYVGDFMVISGDDTALQGWDGYAPDSYFSGVVVKLSRDCEQYRVGTYIN